ncbi:MAG: preprotein translocase subunit SecE [Oscillospiraceae bacterium]|nr:preprotein translocase subunit SecE [Oscillospiraceae bacterium]MBQ4256310.1 preprotein translocase subunit SecE [Oscillospiraceae bacterium]MBQ9209248.1 preprotein translocase subunit SecE [Oscillospiraceae bacterium]MBR4347278.1 preprotein translocase subunit SecE [Oscillospiraceae bacterium]
MAEKDTAKKAAKADKADKPAVKGKTSNNVKKPNKVAKYFRDLRSEFKKVVWPSRKTVVNNTAVVIVTMIVTGLGVFAMDTVFAKLLETMLNFGG